MTIIDLTENKSKMYKEINYHKFVDLLYEQEYEIEKLKKENEQLRKVCSCLKKENQSLIENIFDIYEKVKWVVR